MVSSLMEDWAYDLQGVTAAAEHQVVLTFSLWVWVSWGSAGTAMDGAAIVRCGLAQNAEDGCLQRGGV